MIALRRTSSFSSRSNSARVRVIDERIARITLLFRKLKRLKEREKAYKMEFSSRSRERKASPGRERMAGFAVFLTVFEASSRTVSGANEARNRAI